MNVKSSKYFQIESKEFYLFSTNTKLFFIFQKVARDDFIQLMNPLQFIRTIYGVLSFDNGITSKFYPPIEQPGPTISIS